MKVTKQSIDDVKKICQKFSDEKSVLQTNIYIFECRLVVHGVVNNNLGTWTYFIAGENRINADENEMEDAKEPDVGWEAFNFVISPLKKNFNKIRSIKLLCIQFVAMWMRKILRQVKKERPL